MFEGSSSVHLSVVEVSPGVMSWRVGPVHKAGHFHLSLSLKCIYKHIKYMFPHLEKTLILESHFENVDKKAFYVHIYQLTK